MLPASGVTGADVAALKFTQTLRGYKAGEVDWVLDRLGRELDQLRGELAAVRATQGLGAETGTAFDGADVSHGADDSRVSDVSGVAEDVQVPDAEWEGR